MAAITTDQGMKLLAEHIGVDLETLQKASEDRREAQRITRLEAQILAQKQAEAAALERARKQFMHAWESGHIIVRVDGKILPKPKDICKDGEEDMAPVIHRTMQTRQQILNGFHGFNGTDPSILKAATVSKEVTCTCGTSHKVDVFITCFETK